MAEHAFEVAIDDDIDIEMSQTQVHPKDSTV